MRKEIAVIRMAQIADLVAVVAFHVRLWRDTYSAMAPKEATLMHWMRPTATRRVRPPHSGRWQAALTQAPKSKRHR